jgi:tRNA dimethylallyltransferase
MPSKRLIAICGSTASGKTDLAIRLAEHYKTEILSVDARQVYREMPIGTAQPDAAQLAAVPHHFIASHSIHEPLTAARYADEANGLLNELFKKHDTVIAAGGSTLYYRALLEGLDDIPAVSSKAQKKVHDLYTIYGMKGLQEEVRTHDPEFYSKADIQNPRRLVRALEVYYSTGTPISFYHGQAIAAEYPYEQVIKIGLDMPREELYSRIDKRCEIMLKNGLLEEVKSLYPYKDLRPLQTVGYSEFFGYLDDKMSYDEAVSKFKQHTRNYAKRQLTWFKKDEEVRWFRPEQIQDILTFINHP